jgi:hypothetical protein
MLFLCCPCQCYVPRTQRSRLSGTVREYGHGSRGTWKQESLAGEGQHQSIDGQFLVCSRKSTVVIRGSESAVMSLETLSCIRRHYQATTSEGIKDSMLAVMICRICRVVKVLQLFVITSYKCSINPIQTLCLVTDT